MKSSFSLFLKVLNFLRMFLQSWEGKLYSKHFFCQKCSKSNASSVWSLIVFHSLFFRNRIIFSRSSQILISFDITLLTSWSYSYSINWYLKEIESLKENLHFESVKRIEKLPNSWIYWAKAQAQFICISIEFQDSAIQDFIDLMAGDYRFQKPPVDE